MRSASKCLPFVTVKDGAYHIGEEAVEFFRSVPSGVAVVVVAGKYRTGKSLLMNKCFLPERKRAEGFGVGNTVNSCTKGIWVYGEVLEFGHGRHKRREAVLSPSRAAAAPVKFCICSSIEWLGVSRVHPTGPICVTLS